MCSLLSPLDKDIKCSVAKIKKKIIPIIFYKHYTESCTSINVYSIFYSC